MHTYGRIDVVIYNSGAIWWASVEKTPFKRFHLMQSINAQGVYATVSSVLPEMYKNGGDGKGEGRIVIISPPIYSRFFKGKTAYAMGKVGMSVLTMGLAVDFEREGKEGMAVSSLWPAVVSSTRECLRAVFLTDVDGARLSTRRLRRLPRAIHRRMDERIFASRRSSLMPSCLLSERLRKMSRASASLTRTTFASTMVLQTSANMRLCPGRILGASCP